jgi:hypothetical protein
MFCADWRGATAMGTAAKTRLRAWMVHSSTCMPPIDPPMARKMSVMPSRSSSAICARAMSAMVIIGKSVPQ